MRAFQIVAVVLAFGTPVLGEETPPQITVSGEGSVKIAPDMATIRIGMTTQGATAKEALDANKVSLAKAIDRIKASGVAEKDIRTSGLSVAPHYETDPDNSGDMAKIAGYTAENEVTVRVLALGTLGALINDVIDDGANTVGGVSFQLQDSVPVEDSARKEAVADARRKAEIFASAAGVKLGQVVSMSERGVYEGGLGPAVMEPEPVSGGTGSMVPVQGGEVAVTASVTIVYAIGE